MLYCPEPYRTLDFGHGNVIGVGENAVGLHLTVVTQDKNLVALDCANPGHQVRASEKDPKPFLKALETISRKDRLLVDQILL
ncbi:hypothetical protein ES703_97465 [subsurface metagenome]